MKKLILLVLIIITCSSIRSQEQKNNVIRPGEVWPDTEGNHINANGGGIIYYKGIYYWFGEARLPRTEMDFSFAAILLVDRWTPSNLADSRHIWLPIEWEKGVPFIKWYPSWDINKLK